MEDLVFGCVGSYLNCKEGEFEKARLSIKAIDEEMFDCGVGNGIVKEWGGFSTFIEEASTTNLRRGSVILVEGD